MASAAISGKDFRTLGLSLAFCIAAAVAHMVAGPVVAFAVSAAALSLLAVVVGHATEHLGSKMSAGATGVIQSALGNLPELMVCIFSLRAGLVDVVKGALVGSILANSVLVLGLALVFGGRKNGVLKFASEPVRMIAVLMLLACTALAIPTLAHVLHTPAEPHESTLSLVCGIVLIALFGGSLPFFIRGEEIVPEEAHEPEQAHPSWPMAFTVGVLFAAGIGAAFVSEWFVDALQPATKALGLSEAFTGLVVVAIAGNAIEQLVGIQLAIKNKGDYAMSVILNSSLQIALLLVPILVMASFFIGPAPMTLVLPPMLLVSLILAALIPAFVIFDGEGIWLEGAALVGLYILIAAAFWWG
ncbi:MAG: calcium/proton exchanger [Armatimonadetes bacterium]|nr:calcium/proton exchanger [Armatimonadota bacterium]